MPRPATEHLAPREQRPIARVVERAWDAILLASIVATAFLLACYKLTDSDLWWHLRGGDCILAHHRCPGLDPFTFGSADRVWIDLHWLFEVVAAVMFRLAGIPGVILLAAATVACSILVSVWRPRRLAPVVVGCWIVPLVLFGYRLDPRPEVFSLLFLAVYLAILDRARRRPALVWILPIVEVFWVNMHGLFVIGPIVYALFLVAQVASRRFSSTDESGRPPSAAMPWPYWGAFGAILGACLVNPYGWGGALLPFELFPKISNPANDYKTYIDEFFSPLEYARRSQAFVHSHAIYYRSLYLLWLGLPLSFVLPALSRMVRDPAAAIRGRQPDELSLRRANRGFFLALAAVILGLIGGTLTLLRPEADNWQAATDQGLFAAVGLLWLLSANGLRQVSLRAAFLAALAGLGQLMTTRFLQGAFAGSPTSGSQLSGLGVFVIGCWGLAAIVTLQAGGDLFRMLLAAAFAYLSFQAVRNLNVFSLVAGIVLAENMGDWLVRDADSNGYTRGSGPAVSPSFILHPSSFILSLSRVVLTGLLAIWIGAICTGEWNRWTGSARQFGIGETPGEFAHDAARFAGSDGLPDRAIAFDLGMASLYVFHNSPDKKVYMDPRLEVPTLETFKNYVAIDDSLHGRGDVWRGELERFGQPLVLLDHRGHTTGEALLLADGDWRCIYYDSLGSVFVSNNSPVSRKRFPTIDLAARHFQGRLSLRESASFRGAKGDEGVRYLEAESLVRLGSELCRWPAATWTWRIPGQWVALDLLAQTGTSPASESDIWALRGRCYWNLVPSFAAPPPRPGETWHNGAGMRWAQATRCFRQALRSDPQHVASLRNLYDTFRARRMPEAQLMTGRLLLAEGIAGALQAQEIEELSQRLAGLDRLDTNSGQPDEGTVHRLVDAGFSATAAEWVQRSGAKTDGWDWQLVDRLAATWMHLGRPDVARSLWQTAERAPSTSARLSRLADTWWAEGDVAQAEREYRAALDADSGHADTHWALAMLYADRGAAAETRRACEEALECDLTEPQRDELRAVLSKVSEDHESNQEP